MQSAFISPKSLPKLNSIHYWGTHPVAAHPLEEGRYVDVGLNMTNTHIIRSALMAIMETSSSFLNLIT